MFTDVCSSLKKNQNKKQKTKQTKKQNKTVLLNCTASYEFLGVRFHTHDKRRNVYVCVRVGRDGLLRPY